ncbi:MAG TPA: (d)CMP kinase [Aestuariivirga sp.]
MIIAVDGPAAAGKGTVARALAQHFGYHFLDTGTLYRRVGLALLETSDDPRNVKAAVAIARNLNSHPYSDLELRTEAVGAAASIVAVIPEVRTALLAYQRNFADQLPGAVLDGRDIGTIVCPDADVKLFITASPEVRAGRRLAELKSYGADVSFDAVLADIRLRDERDRTRAVAPLVPAADATVIETSEMTAEEAIAAATRVANSAR